MKNIFFFFLLCIFSCSATKQTKKVMIESAIKIQNEPQQFPWYLNLQLNANGEFKKPSSCKELAVLVKTSFDKDFISLIKKTDRRLSKKYIETWSHIESEYDLELFLNALNKVIYEKYDISYYEFYLSSALRYLSYAWDIFPRNIRCKSIDLNSVHQFDIFVINSLISK